MPKHIRVERDRLKEGGREKERKGGRRGERRREERERKSKSWFCFEKSFIWKIERASL